MVAKFYIFKGRRWLELDAVTGKLNGMQERARFLYVTNGTLQVVRSSKVLRGLRSLAVGQQTTVTTGYTLIQKRKRRHRPKKPRPSMNPGPHMCCNCVCYNRQSCQHAPAITTKIITDAVTQTSTQNTQKLTDDAAETIEQKNRPKESIPEQNNRPEEPAKAVEQSNTAKTIESDQNPPKESRNRIIPIEPEICIRNRTPDSESHQSEPSRELYIDIDDVNLIRDVLSKHPEFLGALDETQFNSDENYRNDVLFKLNPLVKVAKTRDMDTLVRRRSEELDVKQFAAILGLTHVADKVDNSYAYKTRRKVEELNSRYERNKRSYVASSNSEDDKENDLRKTKRKIADTSSETSVSSYNSGKTPKISRSETVTKILRSSGALRDVPERPKRNRDRISISSDSDVPNKIQTPPSKRRMLERSSKTNEDKNRTLDTSASSAKTRPKLKDILSNNKIVDKSIESITTPKKNAASPRKITDNASKAVPNKGPKENVTVLTDSDDNFQKKTPSDTKKLKRDSRTASNFQKKILPITTKNKHNLLQKLRQNPRQSTSSTLNKREYSSMEDHAIVAWVGVGGRDRKVNGNQIWRELQDSYSNITGIARSWHSLRNRYLRYILPSLGSLCLDSSLQTKLRAAAARGELKLKRKKSLNKHNSLLAAPPVQSAWSKRRRSPEKHPVSPQKRPISPQKRPVSPQKRPVSPQKRPVSPQKRPVSPQKRPVSPQKRPGWPHKRPVSPQNRPVSPQTAASPLRRILSRNRSNVDNETASPVVERAAVRSLRSGGGGGGGLTASPSYSDLTRKFADKHRYSDSTNSNKISPERETETKQTKSRRLFNPRAL